MTQVTLEELLDAGSHFGHLTRKWDPKMKPYIFMARNGIHIIDLKQTVDAIENACKNISKIVADGGKVLFVGTKKHAKEIVRKEAERCQMFHVTERWLGGMLTNFATVRKSVKHLQNLSKMAIDGTYDKISKKEILGIERNIEKLRKVLGGVEEMFQLPTAIFIVDTIKERIAVSEATRIGIPIFAILDTNSDPTNINYPMPANDDAYKSISIVTKAFSDGILNGLELRIKQEKENEEPEVLQEETVT